MLQKGIPSVGKGIQLIQDQQVKRPRIPIELMRGADYEISIGHRGVSLADADNVQSRKCFLQPGPDFQHHLPAGDGKTDFLSVPQKPVYGRECDFGFP